MVIENYSDMSIDELGSSLLQKKEDDERRAAKRSRKNERIQQALGVLLMGQGIMKNQYKKRSKELESLHKFEMENNKHEAEQIRQISGLTSALYKFEDPGGDIDTRVDAFLNSEHAPLFEQKLQPILNQKIKASTSDSYGEYVTRSEYQNALDIGTREVLKEYLTDNKYKTFTDKLKGMYGDMDARDLFQRGISTKESTVTAFEKRQYEKVLAEAKAEGNLLGGFRKVLSMFSKNEEKKGGFDIWSKATEADLAGPTPRDLLQSLDVGGMINIIGDEAITSARKSNTRWRELAISKGNQARLTEIGNFEAGPLAELQRLVKADKYPSELQGTMTRIDSNNIEDLFSELNADPAQKQAFATDVTALSLRLKQDREFLRNVYSNTEGKKGKGKKSFTEFREIMSNPDSRAQFSAMLAINEGFKDRSNANALTFGIFGRDETYTSYGVLPSIYNSIGLSNTLGDGVNVSTSGEISLGKTYPKMTLEQKQTAIKEEAENILRTTTTKEQERNVRLSALEDEVDANFDQDMQAFLEDLATEKRNTPKIIESDKIIELRKNLENQKRIGDRGKLGGGTSYIKQAQRKLDVALERESKKNKTAQLFNNTDENIQQVSSIEEPQERIIKVALENINEEKPEEIKNNRILPINIRQLAYDLIGGDKEVTEKDLSTDELEAMRTLITPTILSKGKLEYDDYNTGTKFGDVGMSREENPVTKSFKSPEYALKTFLGQASVYQNDKGEVIIEDAYDFNDADNEVTIDSFMTDMKVIFANPLYLGPRKVAKYFGSKPGEGSPIKINLGKIDFGKFA